MGARPIVWTLIASALLVDVHAGDGSAPAKDGRLRLPPYAADPYARPTEILRSNTNLPRFESSVEVLEKAPPDFNATLALFWHQWQFDEYSIYGHGIDIQPKVNFLRIIDWLKKAKEKKKDEMKPAEEEPSDPN